MGLMEYNPLDLPPSLASQGRGSKPDDHEEGGSEAEVRPHASPGFSEIPSGHALALKRVWLCLWLPSARGLLLAALCTELQAGSFSGGLLQQRLAPAASLF